MRLALTIGLNPTSDPRPNPCAHLCELQDLLQLADEEDLLLAVGERPELEQRPQHRLRQLRVLLHELRARGESNSNQGSGQGSESG